MKIKDGVLLKTEKDFDFDFYFRKKLKKILNEWFELETKDIVQLLGLMQVENKNCKITLKNEDHFHFEIFIKSKQSKTEVCFCRGNMQYPFPLCKVEFEDGTGKLYTIRKQASLIKVDEIT